jgi:hypothetical protein
MADGVGLSTRLTIHRNLVLKKPYERKLASLTIDFTRMAKAESKRRRRRGTSGQIVTTAPRLLWTPKH